MYSNPVVTLDWQHFAIPLREDRWQMRSGTWGGLLTNVTSVLLSLDMVFGGPLDGNVDNFALIGFPTRLTIQVGDVDVCWNSRTNLMYQVQYRSELTTNVWMDLGAPIAGNGTTNCITDSVRGQARRFYRVVTVP
jgi:hypothetical protein